MIFCRVLTYWVVDKITEDDAGLYGADAERLRAMYNEPIPAGFVPVDVPDIMRFNPLKVETDQDATNQPAATNAVLVRAWLDDADFGALENDYGEGAILESKQVASTEET